VFSTILVGTTPIGGAISGVLASAYDTPTAILIGGVAGVAITVLALLLAWRWGLVGRGPQVAEASS
jgi:hypothetical protein